MKLVKYDAMCRAIEMAHAVDEVKDIRDKAVALEHYARQAQNTDAERRAAEIRLRAERKAGQLLSTVEKTKPPGKKIISPRENISKGDVLKTNGISPKQASQWEKLGAMPQREFNLAIGESVKPPTTAGVLRAATAVESTAPRQTVSSDALWLWGRLKDFERDGLLDKSPSDVIETMTDPMKDDVHRLAPKVAFWLKRIGAMQ